MFPPYPPENKPQKVVEHDKLTPDVKKKFDPKDLLNVS